MAMYELTEKGKRELANPKEWARSPLPIKLVETLERHGDVEALRPAEAVHKKIVSWKRLGWVKEVGARNPAPKQRSKSARTSPKKQKSAKKKTAAPKEEPPTTGQLLTMAKTA